MQTEQQAANSEITDENQFDLRAGTSDPAIADSAEDSAWMPEENPLSNLTNTDEQLQLEHEDNSENTAIGGEGVDSSSTDRPDPEQTQASGGSIWDMFSWDDDEEGEAEEDHNHEDAGLTGCHLHSVLTELTWDAFDWIRGSDHEAVSNEYYHVVLEPKLESQSNKYTSSQNDGTGDTTPVDSFDFEIEPEDAVTQSEFETTGLFAGSLGLDALDGTPESTTHHASGYDATTEASEFEIEII